MHLACPHCQSPIELVTLRASGEVVCASCGSKFRVESDSTVDRGGSAQGRKLARFELITAVGLMAMCAKRGRR